MDERLITNGFRIGVLVCLLAIVALEWKQQTTLQDVDESLSEVRVRVVNSDSDKIPVSGKVEIDVGTCLGSGESRGCSNPIPVTVSNTLGHAVPIWIEH